MQPKISILVPVYNVEQYIERCARSLFEQTLQELEFIFVDDGSPDNSIAILQQVIDQYPNRKDQVRILRHEHNKGLPEARRTAIKAATGEYIQHVDSDDYTDPTMSEKLYNLALAENADMAVCDFYHVWENGQKRFTSIRNWQDDGGASYREQVLQGKPLPMVWLRIVRRSVYDQISDKYYPAANNMEDNVFAILTAFYSHKFCYLPEPLYYYWGNPNSVTKGGKQKTKKRLLFASDRQRNIQVIENFITDIGALDKYYITLLKLKSSARNRLLISQPNLRFWWKWLTMYPDLNRAMLFGNKYVKATKRSRLWFLACALGLFPILKKQLLSRKYCPAYFWRTGLGTSPFTIPKQETNK